jgi:hypothetical protein
VFAIGDDFGDAHEDFLPLVACQFGLVVGGYFEGAGNLRAAGARHGADDFAVIGIENIDVLAGIAIDQFAGDAHFFVSVGHNGVPETINYWRAWLSATLKAS